MYLGKSVTLEAMVLERQLLCSPTDSPTVAGADGSLPWFCLTFLDYSICVSTPKAESLNVYFSLLRMHVPEARKPRNLVARVQCPDQS